MTTGTDRPTPRPPSVSTAPAPGRATDREDRASGREQTDKPGAVAPGLADAVMQARLAVQGLHHRDLDRTAADRERRHAIEVHARRVEAAAKDAGIAICGPCGGGGRG